MPLQANRVAVSRLVFTAGYAVAFMAAGFGHWSQPVELALWTVVSVLWLALVVFLVVGVSRRRGLWTFLRENLAVPLLLLSPVFLLLQWDAVWFLMVIAAYVVELRRIPAGDGFLFSFVLIAFVGLLAALTMVEVENDNPESGFRSPSDGLYWAFAGLLRINTDRTYTHLTVEGRHLAVTMAICGVIAASMFTARLVAWVIGERRPAEAKGGGEDEGVVDELRVQVARLDGRVAALQAEMDPPPPPDS